MSSRFITNVLFVLAGAIVVVCSQAFAPGPTGWITFGIALGILSVVGLVQFDRNRGLTQYGVDALIGVLAVWTAIASMVFNDTALTWLSFGEGIGFVGLAVVGLIVHELSTERVVHSLAPVRSEHYEEAA